MNVYDVVLELDNEGGYIEDVTEVEGETEAEALEVACDVFRENDYDVDAAQFTIEFKHRHHFPDGTHCDVCGVDINDL